MPKLPLRPLLVSALLLAAAGCEQKADTIDIPAAKTKADLTLSAFECSLLAPDQAGNTRLFNVGLASGREFLDFADNNVNGYTSIQPQIDPVWAMVAARPSADFKLGELYAATMARVYADRERFDENRWAQRKADLFAERNCNFIGAKPVAN